MVWLLTLSTCLQQFREGKLAEGSADSLPDVLGALRRVVVR
jgi:hypothetical protein